MNRTILSLLISLLITSASYSQQNNLLFLSTRDDSTNQFLEIPNIGGGHAESGWIWHMILDIDDDGLNIPSLELETMGLPGEGDSLLLSGILGDSKFIADSVLAVMSPFTFNDNYTNHSLYLRVFGSDTLVYGIPYMENGESGILLEPGFMSTVSIPFFSYERGGLMDLTLTENGRPDIIAGNEIELDPQIDTLNYDIPDRADLQITTSEGGTGITEVRLEYFSDVDPSWNMDMTSMPWYLILKTNQRYDAGLDWNETLRIKYSEAEVTERFDDQYAPEDMRLYHLTQFGWLEDLHIPEHVDTDWYFDLIGYDSPFFGRWVIAPSGATSSLDENSLIVTEFKLHPIYPSPFNPDARIRLDLPERSLVKLEVYNILGQSIKILNNSVLPTGIHNFIFRGQDLASGTYFLHVKAGQYKDVQKMVLLR